MIAVLNRIFNSIFADAAFFQVKWLNANAPNKMGTIKTQFEWWMVMANSSIERHNVDRFQAVFRVNRMMVSFRWSICHDSRGGSKTGIQTFLCARTHPFPCTPAGTHTHARPLIFLTLTLGCWRGFPGQRKSHLQAEVRPRHRGNVVRLQAAFPRPDPRRFPGSRPGVPSDRFCAVLSSRIFYPPERIASMVVLTEFMMLVELKRRLDADFILENAEEHRGFEAVFMGVQLRFFAGVVHYGSYCGFFIVFFLGAWIYLVFILLHRNPLITFFPSDPSRTCFDWITPFTNTSLRSPSPSSSPGTTAIIESFFHPIPLLRKVHCHRSSVISTLPQI